jgi:hypothetical protein
MREYTRRPEAKPFPVPCLAGSKLDRLAWLSSCWRLQKNAHSPRKLLIEKITHKICCQWANLLWAKICSINLLTENQFCLRRINFAHGESWIALQYICNLSMYAWHDFYLHTNCSNRRKFAHSKEKLLTKIKFAQSKILLKKFAHSRNLLIEFARSIEKLLTMKNLAGLDGSTRWLHVSHQANQSTAGAHHSTVSFVTAGTCWAGPSRNYRWVHREAPFPWIRVRVRLNETKIIVLATE